MPEFQVAVGGLKIDPVRPDGLQPGPSIALPYPDVRDLKLAGAEVAVGDSRLQRSIGPRGQGHGQGQGPAEEAEVAAVHDTDPQDFAVHGHFGLRAAAPARQGDADLIIGGRDQGHVGARHRDLDPPDRRPVEGPLLGCGGARPLSSMYTCTSCQPPSAAFPYFATSPKSFDLWNILCARFSVGRRHPHAWPFSKALPLVPHASPSPDARTYFEDRKLAPIVVGCFGCS